MRFSRLSIVLAGSVLLSGCQSIEDGFRYGFGYEANGPAGSTSGHARRSVSTRSETRNYAYNDEPRNSGSTYSDSSSSNSGNSGFKRTRYKTTETTSAGTLVDRDENGNIVRTGSTFENNTTYRNTDGTISSTVYRTPAGTDVERDSDGQIVTTSYANPSGDTVTYRNGNGSILGTKYTSPAGNVTYRDASGRITGSDFR